LRETQKSESFEQTLERFETLVKTMEAGGQPLEIMLRLYEEGVALSRQLQNQLQKAQGKLTELHLQGETPVEEPMEYTP
jgi:exodeoxyribonuclease VII small subunit